MVICIYLWKYIKLKMEKYSKKFKKMSIFSTNDGYLILECNSLVTQYYSLIYIYIYIYILYHAKHNVVQ